MNIFFKLSFFCLLILVSCSSTKTDLDNFNEMMRYRPKFKDFVTAGENSSLAMRCTGKEPFDVMLCRFNSVNVIARPSADNLKKWAQERRSQLTKDMDELFKDPKKVSAEKEMMNVVLSTPEDPKLKQELEKYTPQKALDFLEFDKEDRKSLACFKHQNIEQQKKCLVEINMKQFVRRNDVCTIHTHETGAFKFIKMNKNQWVSTFSLCGTKTIRTLTYAGESEDWEKTRPLDKDWSLLVESTAIPLSEAEKSFCTKEDPITASRDLYEYGNKASVKMDCGYIAL